MKMERKILLKYRLSALTLIGMFLIELFFPSLAIALSGRQQQVDYMSYQSYGSTDMVNLSTGNFVYSIPLLIVPGPESDFKIPLTYNGGISINQESSWVGLGWTLNVGSINRTASIFPDDYAGESITSLAVQQGGSHRAYSFDIAIVGFSYDSEMGYGGKISFAGNTIGFGTQEHIGAFGIVATANGISGYGFSLGDRGVSFTPSAESFSAIAGLVGFESTLYDGFNKFNSLVKFVNGLAELGIDNSISTRDKWTIKNESKNFGVYQSTKTRWYLDYAKIEKAYGSLYSAGVQAAQTKFDGSSSGPGSKVYVMDQNSQDWYDGDANNHQQYFLPPKLNGKDGIFYNTDRVSDVYVTPTENFNAGPISTAFDTYIVNSENISGLISPFRVDIGSVKTPAKKIGSLDMNFHTSSFLPYSDGIKYKPQFKYSGTNINKYDYHSNVLNEFSYSQDASGYYHTFLNSRSYLNTSEPNRADGSLINNRLKYGKNIEWATNWDMLSDKVNYTPNGYFGDNPIYKGKIIDHLKPSDRSIIRNSFPKLGIGAFSITNEDGFTYHYTLPIYSSSNIEYSEKVGVNGYTSTLMDSKYAVHWLLTSITGPDFIDINGNGYIDDEEDYGYWVKFNYGKFNPNYLYRNPYLPDSKIDYLTPGGVTQYIGYSAGVRETYYLNEVKTRTHTALFIKGTRNDGKSSYIQSNGVYSAPSSALKLNEIVVISNTNLKTLRDNFPSLKTPLPVSNNLIVTDNYDAVLDVSDFNSTSRALLGSFQDNKVKLNYYSPGELGELSPLAENSFSDVNDKQLTGKLTLKNISFFGKNDISTKPDFSFEYYNELQTNPLDRQNPPFDLYKFDGWGMFKTNGSGNAKSHGMTEEMPAAFSLKKVINPDGMEVEIKYERDYYSKILDKEPTMNFNITSYVPDQGRLNISRDALFNWIQPGDFVELIPDFTTIGLPNPFIIQISEVGIFGASGGYIKSNDLINLDAPLNCCSLYHLRILNKTFNAPGGDNRVKSIKISNGYGNESETRYVYTKDGSEDGVSSGVISVEPSYIQGIRYGHEDYYEFPNTPLIYSHVYVFEKYSELLNQEVNYLTKELYEFYVPNKESFKIDEKVLVGAQLFQDGNDFNVVSNMKQFQIDVNTSLVGVLKSKRSYNNDNQELSHVFYNYEQLANNYSKSVISSKSEAIASKDDHYNNGQKWTFFVQNLVKSTTTETNSRLKSITTRKHNITNKVQYLKFDELTGEAIETEYSNAKGELFRTKIVPAYTIRDANDNPIYAKMGSKFVDSTNKNMLKAPAAEYLFVYNESNNVWDPLKASVQTWDNYWIYRKFNTTTGMYSSNETITNDAYRKKANYVWNGVSNPDGTFNNFVDFDWNTPSTNTDWLKISQNNLFDHYSHLLESEDIVGRAISTKLNSNNNLILAQANNSKYAEFGYSGAEDELNEFGYFGGEIEKGSGSTIIDVSTDQSHVHTGMKALRLDNAQYGFIFNETFTTGTAKKKRASVWVHKDNLDKLEFTYKYQITNFFTGAVISTPKQFTFTPSVTNNYLKAGDWYLLIIDIPGADDSNVALADKLVVSTRSNGASVYVDDFRVFPYESTMSATVYNDNTGEIMASINAMGLSEKYEYDVAGRLVKTYQEVPDYNGKIGGFKLRKKYDYGYKRD